MGGLSEFSWPFRIVSSHIHLAFMARRIVRQHWNSMLLTGPSLKHRLSCSLYIFWSACVLPFFEVPLWRNEGVLVRRLKDIFEVSDTATISGMLAISEAPTIFTAHLGDCKAVLSLYAVVFQQLVLAPTLRALELLHWRFSGCVLVVQYCVGVQRGLWVSLCRNLWSSEDRPGSQRGRPGVDQASARGLSGTSSSQRCLQMI